MKKRGLSPVIATVLLILLVIVLASLIFLWAKGFVSEQIEKFGQPVDRLCSSVDYSIDLIEPTAGNYFFEINNRGNIDIHSFEIKKHRSGNEEVRKFDFGLSAGSSIKQNVNLKMDNGATPEKITVYPVLIGNIKGKDSNRVFTCLKEGKVINL